ncbi:hypothetical protein [Streptomyces candidus]|uniref:Lipoprotein n=1 Tax=Streptomyces candidus TaxID=67283 RepID=A0A7X0LP87_9ACTN|nr:hypothetical protein [Streptomyces candidus]MBB6435209.1 hypothetical protein [Streptomyces candidus]GHH40455.1 hypothetical protein GCM10018773_21570 [Streptomyces candidus]
MGSRRIWVGTATAALLLAMSACSGTSDEPGAEDGKGGSQLQSEQPHLPDPATSFKDAKALAAVLLRGEDLPTGWTEDAEGDNGGITAQPASCEGPCEGLTFEGVGNYTDSSGALVGTSVKAYGSKDAAVTGYTRQTELADDARREDGPPVGNAYTYVKAGEDDTNALRVIHFRVGTTVVAISQEYRSEDAEGLQHFAEDQAKRVEKALAGGQ